MAPKTCTHVNLINEDSSVTISLSYICYFQTSNWTRRMPIESRPKKCLNSNLATINGYIKIYSYKIYTYKIPKTWYLHFPC